MIKTAQLHILKYFILISFLLFVSLTSCKTRLQLTSISKSIIDEYLNDENKLYKLANNEDCIRMDFVIKNTNNTEVTIYNYDIEETCREYSFLSIYKGYCIFYKGKPHSLFIEKNSAKDSDIDDYCCNQKINTVLKDTNKNVDILPFDSEVSLEYDPALDYIFFIKNNQISSCKPKYLEKIIDK